MNTGKQLLDSVLVLQSAVPGDMRLYDVPLELFEPGGVIWRMFLLKGYPNAAGTISIFNWWNLTTDEFIESFSNL